MARANHNLLEEALLYLRRELPIFPVCGLVAHTHPDEYGNPQPCTDRGKVPLVKWKPYQDRLPTETEVRAWWRRNPDANIGLATGHLSGLVVLDLDGDLAVREALARGYDNGPHAFTGRVGGQHRYFAWREDAPRNFAKRNGIDFRGEGGYVILPPSRHASGRAYVWGEELGDERPELPEWVDEMAAKAQPGPPSASVVEGDITRHRNVTLTSLAGSMRRRGMSETAILAALRAENEARCKPPLEDAEVRKIAHSVASYEPSEPPPAPSDPVAKPNQLDVLSLDEVLDTFRRWLHLADPAPVCMVLATVAANYSSGDPLWLMLIGAASGGKTELLNAIAGLRSVHLSATLTEAALLSGTPKREKDRTAKGGLLRVIGDFGILLCKDFTSILSMNRDPRAGVLAALREIYDGSWTRHVGVDGGRTLSWTGKLGLIAGCTAAIDSHHQVTAAMGERFLYCRLLDIPAREQGLRALANTGHEFEMRRELADAVSAFFAGLDLGQPLEPLSDDEAIRLVDLASLAARARSGVERDGRTREIDLILDPEAPARLVQALRRLYGGLRVIGVDRELAWEYTVRAGLDCMPKVRRGVFDILANTDGPSATSTLAAKLGYPTSTTRRSLEDLAVHLIVEREPGDPGRADAWRLTTWARQRYESAMTVPEMSVPTYTFLINAQRTVSDFSGTVSA